ncbi:glutathione S-transferase, partial [Mycena vulgaris]
PFELVVTEVAKGDHTAPEYVAKHMHPLPSVLTPRWHDDDGFILYESCAICHYLAEKHVGRGTTLLPATLEGNALFEQAASIEFANFYPQIMKIRIETLYKKRMSLPIDEAALAQGRSDRCAKLDVYEVILGKPRFLAGDAFTLADRFHPIMHQSS